MLLLVASLAAGAYLLLGRGGGSGGGSQGFVATSQNVVAAAESVPSEAQKIQQFLELGYLDRAADAALLEIDTSVSELKTIATQSTGQARQLVEIDDLGGPAGDRRD